MSDDADDLLDLFNDLESKTSTVGRDQKILRAPFGYPGGKSRSLGAILARLPNRGAYVEPFGGSAAVLLARKESKLEVFNDRYGGVVAFYRCIRDEEKMNALCDRLHLAVHSREEFVWCKASWENPTLTDVERAARWYYMVQSSFGSLGRNWGRGTKAGSAIAGKIRNKLKAFPAVHARFRKVQVENQDWEDCMRDYDQPNTVFYLDPPYVDVNRGTYRHEMTRAQHRHMLDVIFNTKGFVALSGYDNSLYDSREWDDKFTWSAYQSIKSVRGDGNFKDHIEGEKRGRSQEGLWIKESRG